MTMTRPSVYTRDGDDGTTGLFYGGRVPKDSVLPRAYGTVDEAQSILGVVRAEAGHGSEVESMLIPIMRDLWVLMAELATLPENRSKLTPGASCVEASMVTRLENMNDVRHGSMLLAPWFAAPNVIQLRPLQRLRRPCRTSTACRICCGLWLVGTKEKAFPCAACHD